MEQPRINVSLEIDVIKSSLAGEKEISIKMFGRCLFVCRI